MIKPMKVLRYFFRVLRFVCKALCLFITLMLIISAVIFFRFHHAPQDIQTLMPKLTALIIPKNADFTITTQQVFLETDLDRQGFIKINIKGMKILSKQNGQLWATFPEVRLFYGVRKLLTFDARPNVTEILKARAYITVDKAGQITVQHPVEDIANIDSISAPLTGKDLKNMVMYFFGLGTVSVQNSFIIFQDARLNKQMQIQDMDILLKKQRRHQHLLKIQAQTDETNGNMQAQATCQIDHQDHTITFDAKVKNINTKAFFLKDIPFQTDMNLMATLSGVVDLKRSATLWRQWLTHMDIDIHQTQASSLTVPQLDNHTWHIQKFSLKNTQSDDFNISSWTGDFMINHIPITWTADTDLINYFDTHDAKAIRTLLQFQLKPTEFQNVMTTWPQQVLPDVYGWLKNSVRTAHLNKGTLNFALQGLDLDKMAGHLALQKATVDYLGKLPPLEEGDLELDLTQKRVKIKVNKAKVLQNLHLKNGTVDLYDLDTNIEKALIKFDADGALTDVLTVIDKQPLDFLSAFHLKPQQAMGNISATVQLAFPIKKDLTPKEVNVNVAGVMGKSTVTLPKITFDVMQGHLAVDNHGLNLNGKGKYQNLDFSFDWKEKFDSQKITSVYKINTAPTQAQLASFIPKLDKIMTGTADITALIQKNQQGKYLGQVTANLDKALLNLFPLSYEKKAGVAAQLNSSFTIDKDPKIKFTLTDKAGLSLKGYTQWAPDIQVVLDEVKSPKNDFKITLVLPKKGGMTLFVTGKQWEAYQLFNNPLLDKTQSNASAPIKNIQTTPQNVSIDIKLDKLILHKDKPFTPLQFKFHRQGSLWKNFELLLQGKERFYILLKPNNRFIGGGDDVGDILSRLGATDRILKGKATLTGRQNPKEGIEWNIDLTDFTLKDSGFMTQALTILGIIDAFRGKELTFDKGEIGIDIPLTQSFVVKDSYLSGRNLGLTFMGQIGLKQINLSGSVIPAYAINSLPGKIPFIGAVFRDSAKGGVFGAKYDMTGTLFSPKIEFKTLKSAAPGFLGRFFK